MKVLTIEEHNNPKTMVVPEKWGFKLCLHLLSRSLEYLQYWCFH
jgi:hypothetical protein